MGVFSQLLNIFTVGTNDYSSDNIINKSYSNTVDLNKSQRAVDSKAVVEDPLAIVASLGYKDKPFSLSYDTLKKMSCRNSVVASIVQTRINQVSSFSQPARYTKDNVGFEITLRDPKQKPNKEQSELILALESFIENCGYSYNPSRDNFDTFLRKVIRDSLVYDQLTFEIVPDRLGRPAELYAVDGSTIRAATVDADNDQNYLYNTDLTDSDAIKWVQVVDGQVVSEFTGYELAFAVRNPRTDILIQPYGLSELEVLIHQITSHLWAEEYNSRYFSQGGTTKGILNLKGANLSRTQLEAFRRQWTAQLSGLTGAWKTPVVSVDGLEYINVSQSNREMEFELWMNYLINICCAVYQIDPAEINFPNRGGSGGGTGGGLGDGGIEDRLKNSKDKGLRPLLRFIESIVNRYIIRRFTNDLSFNFVGLNQEEETEKQGVMDKQIRTFKTVNEIRKERDLPELEGGDIILDPTYTNYILQKQQNEAMAQGEDMGTMDEGGDISPEQEQEAPNPEVQWQEGNEKEPTQEDVQQQQEFNDISDSIDQNL